MRTLPALDDLLDSAVFEVQQFYIGRVILGGMFVRLVDTWVSVTVLRECDDGTRYFHTENGSSFHSSFIGIGGFQEFM